MADQHLFGDGLAWGGITIIHFLGQKERFEVFDFAYHIVRKKERKKERERKRKKERKREREKERKQECSFIFVFVLFYFS